MLLAASAIKGYAITATDGRLGTVSDLLFDDTSWKIRWLVIDTGTWLTGRKVLMHPSAISKADNDSSEIQVALTKAQIEASPEISANEPVSGQMESQLYEYYGWDPYWGSSYFISGAMASPLSASPYFGAPLASGGFRADPANRDMGDPHLRSVVEITGYHLHATDGPIGHVENVYIDDGGWDIRYLIVDTRNWWSGAHVLLSPFAVKEIDWPASEIRLNVTREQVKTSPPWDPQKMIDQMYEKGLHRHYNWLGYGF
jgi:sporulation protein YlmC with PRC-barrel domain